jgi:hypothetical protein
MSEGRGVQALEVSSSVSPSRRQEAKDFNLKSKITQPKNLLLQEV